MDILTSPVKINISRTLYVDPVNGNDATGKRGNAGKPFATIAAANAAKRQGDLIHLRAGVHHAEASLVQGSSWYSDDAVRSGNIITLTVKSALTFEPESHGLSVGDLVYLNSQDNGVLSATGVYPILSTPTPSTLTVRQDGADETLEYQLYVAGLESFYAEAGAVITGNSAELIATDTTRTISTCFVQFLGHGQIIGMGVAPVNVNIGGKWNIQCVEISTRRVGNVYGGCINGGAPWAEVQIEAGAILSEWYDAIMGWEGANVHCLIRAHKIIAGNNLVEINPQSTSTMIIDAQEWIATGANRAAGVALGGINVSIGGGGTVHLKGKKLTSYDPCICATVATADYATYILDFDEMICTNGPAIKIDVAQPNVAYLLKAGGRVISKLAESPAITLNDTAIVQLGAGVQLLAGVGATNSIAGTGTINVCGPIIANAAKAAGITVQGGATNLTVLAGLR